MLKIIGKIFYLVLLPLIIAGAFFVWSLPRITTDYNFNADELIYLARSNYWDAYKSGDFESPIWSSWEVYDQPQLTNYIFAQIPGDRGMLSNVNSPCTSDISADHYNAWGCLDGKPINTWPLSTQYLGSFVTRARTLALYISSLTIMTTYYLGLLVSGPLAGILAVLYLGGFSFFRGLSTMVMEDQTLILFLNLQFIVALNILRRKQSNVFLYLALGLVTGLAFATKLSAVIPTIIIYSYLSIYGVIKKQHNLAKLVVSALFSAFIFVGLHPFLWSNPVGGMAKMLQWRSLQIAAQAGSSNQLPTLVSKVIYSLKEGFSFPVLSALALISLLILLRLSPSFAIISGINLLIFVLAIPLSWNRYLLPVMPAIAIYLGNLPSLFIMILKKIKDNFVIIKQFLSGVTTALLFLAILFLLPTSSYLASFIFLISLFLIVQGFLVTRSMLYGFSQRTKEIIPHRSPKHSFSLIVPARDESAVIGTTIQSLSKLNYPQELYEVLVMIRADDYATIQAASQAIIDSHANNIRIIQIDGDAHNKSYSLNIGLHVAKYDIIGIFDAEDEPHKDILTKVNDYLLAHPHAGAVQAPVHLTNLNSSWFSSLSAIEYYYWFASVLPFLATKGIIPLGGNTIFTKKEIYASLGYYDETCLTEDADLGVRLATSNIKVGVIEDVALATLEESPESEIDVIRQRSRWDQGYLQVLDKSLWVTLSPKQKLYALYTLTQPIFRHLSFLNMIFAPLMVAFGTIPLWIALLSFIPAYFLILQLGLYLLGLAELAKLHQVKVSVWRYGSTLLAFVPYQALLTLATLRALGKMFVGNYKWDKTSHTNAHRPGLAILEA